MHIDPTEISPKERYKLLIGGVVPRPIAFVSTRSVQGVTNLAPFSFFTAVGGRPMLLAFCPANHADGAEKDTLRNAKPITEGGTGEFVINVVSEAFAAKVAAAAESLEPDESEFDLTGLQAADSTKVRAPRVAEAPLSYECVTERVLRFAEGEPGGANMIFGKVVMVHAREGIVDERFHVDPNALAAFGRMGGSAYARTRERFDMPFGKDALDMEDPFS